MRCDVTTFYAHVTTIRSRPVVREREEKRKETPDDGTGPPWFQTQSEPWHPPPPERKQRM
ncbi:conserved protein of unknown function [Streptomyces murinus]